MSCATAFSNSQIPRIAPKFQRKPNRNRATAIVQPVAAGLSGPTQRQCSSITLALLFVEAHFHSHKQKPVNSERSLRSEESLFFANFQQTVPRQSAKTRRTQIPQFVKKCVLGNDGWSFSSNIDVSSCDRALAPEQLHTRLLVTENYKYVVIGRGRWAPRIQSILASEGRTVSSLENARRATDEDEPAYHQRLARSFKASTAHIAWLCIPPGDHIPVLMAAAIESGLHVIVEKPWHCSHKETSHLEMLARSHRAVVAIHYEYCLLDAVQNWRRQFNGGNELHFSGRLTIQRPNHIGLPALDNLGSHLFAIHQYSVPHAVIDEISCGYERPDERHVWLESRDRQIAEIDLLANKEPIIQRFIAQFESAIRDHADFPFDLQFALRVAERIALWRQPSRHKE
jgi:hypothetical protein